MTSHPLLACIDVTDIDVFFFNFNVVRIYFAVLILKTTTTKTWHIWNECLNIVVCENIFVWYVQRIISFTHYWFMGNTGSLIRHTEPRVICEMSHEKGHSDICGHCNCRTVYASLQFEQRDTLTALLWTSVWLIYLRTVMHSDQTAWMDMLIWNYTVHIWSNAPFHMMYLFFTNLISYIHCE